MSEDGFEESAFEVVCRSSLHARFDIADIQRWESGRFRMERMLQGAPRNKGRVDHMLDAAFGEHVAVKRVPNDWMCECQALFARQRARETERPWVDLGCSAFLTTVRFPYACPLRGVYRSKDFTHIVSDLASEGDLFSWSLTRSEGPGLAREAVMWPLARQVMDAVRMLHDLSIVHRDISAENILVTRNTSDGVLQIQLIDFGMATRSRYGQGNGYGKPVYQAPETHSGMVLDGFLLDAFAVGVVLCGMLTQQHPWMSTRPGGCKASSFYSAHGFRALAQRRKCFGKRQTMAQCISEAAMQVLDGLLSVEPAERLILGETAPFDGNRRSVWQEPWVLTAPRRHC